MPLIAHARIENGKKEQILYSPPPQGRAKRKGEVFKWGERGVSINMSTGKLIMRLAINSVCI